MQADARGDSHTLPSLHDHGRCDMGFGVASADLMDEQAPAGRLLSIPAVGRLRARRKGLQYNQSISNFVVAKVI